MGDSEGGSKTEYMIELEEDGVEAIRSEVSLLIKDLYADPYDTRCEATKKLIQIAHYYPDTTIPACGKIRNLVRTDRLRVQNNCLRILTHIGSQNPEEIRTTIGTAVSLLYDENAKIRETATRLLVVATNPFPQKVRPAIPRFIEILDDPNELPRGPAAQAIAQLALHFPSDVDSEEVTDLLDIMINPPEEERRRGPDLESLRNEQARHAQQALENIEQAAKEVHVQLPEGILDDELRLHVVDLFENGQYQPAVRQAFIVLEERIRTKGGYSYADYGSKMVEQAFSTEGGPLTFGQTQSEKVAVLLAYKSAFQMFRNPTNHRFLDNMDGKYSYHIICYVNLLLLLLGPK